MKAILKKKINDAVMEFELEGKDIKEIMLKAEPLLENDYCWLEGFEDATIKWQTSLAEKDGAKYIYVKKVARTKDGRTASRTLGTYKGDFGNFWNKWEEYKKGNETEGDPLDI
jgi:hypothetical protein